MLKAAKHCASVGKTYCLNLSAPFLCQVYGVLDILFEARSTRKDIFYFPNFCFQFFKDQMSSVLPFTDVVFGNETEAAAYAESFELNTSDIGEIAMKIAQLPKVRYRTKVSMAVHQDLLSVTSDIYFNI